MSNEILITPIKLYIYCFRYLYVFQETQYNFSYDEALGCSIFPCGVFFIIKLRIHFPINESNG
jgi:hypothetical protein